MLGSRTDRCLALYVHQSTLGGWIVERHQGGRRGWLPESGKSDARGPSFMVILGDGTDILMGAGGLVFWVAVRGRSWRGGPAASGAGLAAAAGRRWSWSGRALRGGSGLAEGPLDEVRMPDPVIPGVGQRR